MVAASVGGRAHHPEDCLDRPPGKTAWTDQSRRRTAHTRRTSLRRGTPCTPTEHAGLTGTKFATAARSPMAIPCLKMSMVRMSSVATSATVELVAKLCGFEAAA